MKLRHLVETESQRKGRVIAQFGRATLIQPRKGKWLLQGGTREDHSEAREWISLFMHEVVVQREA